MDKPLKAKVIDGRIVCPKCGAMLGKAYYGASAFGVELWCKSKCRKPVLLEIKADQQRKSK